MSNVTEMSLDDLDSSVPNVSIERIDEPTPSTHIPVVATEKASDGIEDLDLLVDPAKSRNSPVPATSQTLQSDQSSDISKPEPLPLEEPKVVAVEKDDIDFQIKLLEHQKNLYHLPFHHLHLFNQHHQETMVLNVKKCFSNSKDLSHEAFPCQNITAVLQVFKI